jgi:transposase
LLRLPERLRKKVHEVTLDMAAGMHLIVKRCFPYAHRVVDRFHIQQLASEAVQEIRIKHRWQAIDQENEQYLFERPHFPNGAFAFFTKA